MGVVKKMASHRTSKQKRVNKDASKQENVAAPSITAIIAQKQKERKGAPVRGK